MRTHGERTAEVRRRLLERITDGSLGPGSRFLSNRAIADRFGVSYQTADALVRGLCEEGWLVRRPSSGTYLPGSVVAFRGAALHFPERAKRPGSFGDRLRQGLLRRFAREGIETVSGEGLSEEDGAAWFPLMLDRPDMLALCVAARGRGLVLNDRPPSGLDSVLLDSVSVDDFSGGVCAGQIVARELGPVHPCCVVGGPFGDRRGEDRRRGFQSVVPGRFVRAGWFAEDGYRVADEVLSPSPQSVFCANDRLAEGLLRRVGELGRKPPLIVGFDDAPVAASLDLTTIAIPWAELADTAVAVVRSRLADARTAAIHHVVAPRPIFRRSSRCP